MELEKVRAGLAKAEEENAAADARREKAEQATAQHRQDLLRTISTLTGSRNRLGDLDREQDRLTYALGQLDPGSKAPRRTA